MGAPAPKEAAWNPGDRGQPGLWVPREKAEVREQRGRARPETPAAARGRCGARPLRLHFSDSLCVSAGLGENEVRT